MKNLAINIKKERKINELSQQQVANALKILLRTYQSYEALGVNHREPDNEMLLRIAEVFGTTTDNLLGKR